MIDLTPQPILFQLGPLAIYWYGLCYAAGLAAAYAVLVRQARHYGQDVSLIANGMIVIAIAALIGGRAYHVIDQWALYKDHLERIVLPPYSGLGAYGGLATGTIAFLFLIRHYRVSGWVWADIVAPAVFVMQAIGRWGNFFNQELYGPPTSLPWGIAIDCAHRIEAYACAQYPLATTHFHPLFLYESLSGLIGAAVLIALSRSVRARRWLRPGDLAVVLFIWYAVVRFLLEFLRQDNWRLGDLPTAQLVSLLFIGGALAIFAVRHARPVARVTPVFAADADAGAVDGGVTTPPLAPVEAPPESDGDPAT